MENKRLYNIWSTMKQRCNNPNNTGYRWYGAKGVRVCNEWLEYEVFEKWALDNGYDDSLSIDRIDSNGDYEPSNCQWILLDENRKKALNDAREKNKNAERVTDYNALFYNKLVSIDKSLKLAEKYLFNAANSRQGTQGIRKQENKLNNETLSSLEQEEMKEFISTILLLPKEDRAMLLSNANALKVRRDIEKAKGN